MSILDKVWFAVVLCLMALFFVYVASYEFVPDVGLIRSKFGKVLFFIVACLCALFLVGVAYCVLTQDEEDSMGAYEVVVTSKKCNKKIGEYVVYAKEGGGSGRSFRFTVDKDVYSSLSSGDTFEIAEDVIVKTYLLNDNNQVIGIEIK